jgi:hypothetical protein
MSRLWQEFLSGPAPAGHAVEIYSEIDELAQSVAAFLAAGFELGEPALVVATPGHLAAFSDALAERSWDEQALAQRASLVMADAETTLAAILDEGAPSEARFEAVVGPLVDRATEQAPAGGARVFGEMVDLLTRRGEPRAAVELERLWNRLRQARPISLLCAYRLDVFDGATQTGPLLDLCRSHSHVLPAHDARRFTSAVDLALVKVLGAAKARDVYYIVGGREREKRVPVAQDALRWVAQNLPAQAERVLAVARGKYVEAAGAHAGK